MDKTRGCLFLPVPETLVAYMDEKVINEVWYSSFRELVIRELVTVLEPSYNNTTKHTEDNTSVMINSKIEGN